MTDDLQTHEGLTDTGRRDFLRQAATVSALVWAAPAISSVSRPAFAGTPTPPETETAFSFLAVVFKKCGEDGGVSSPTYQAKYNSLDSRNPGWEDSPGQAPDCPPAGWDPTGNVKVNGADFGLRVDEVDESTWMLFVPADYDCDVAAVAKAGSENGGTLVCASPSGSEELVVENKSAEQQGVDDDDDDSKKEDAETEASQETDDEVKPSDTDEPKVLGTLYTFTR